MNTDAKRYYAMLGLAPACSEEDIRSAFRRRAKELHPDAESGDATAFIRLKRAYDTLSDPAQRALYDRASSARVRKVVRTAFEPPLPPRARPPRPGGMSFARYFVAFLFVGGVSLGAVEAMISYADAPASGSSRPVSLLAGSSARETAARETAARETAKDDWPGGERGAAAASTGFWDASNPNGTPREAEDRTRSRPRVSGFGGLPTE